MTESRRSAPLVSLAVPRSATVIDGAGRYLVPGFDRRACSSGGRRHWIRYGADRTSGTVRCTWRTASRPSSTSAEPPYSSNGDDGSRTVELVGPTIYTAGEFINEPRVNTAQDVEREITAQARAGYDLIKFHEIMDPAQGFTTTGVTLPAYLEMIEAAQANGIPLVGHAPVNLGLEVALRARQPLAHLGTLSNIYFLPLNAMRGWLFLTAAALITLIAVLTAGGVAAFLRRWQSARPRPSARLSRIRVLAGIVRGPPGCRRLSARPCSCGRSAVRQLRATSCVHGSDPGGRRCDSGARGRDRRIWRDASMSSAFGFERLSCRSQASRRCGLASSSGCPLRGEAGDRGIEQLASRVHEAGIPVMTTLVNYDAIGGPGRPRLVQDPVMRYLQPGRPCAVAPRAAGRAARLSVHGLHEEVAGALHRAGVPLMAGTDAMGFRGSRQARRCITNCGC